MIESTPKTHKAKNVSLVQFVSLQSGLMIYL